MSPKYDCCGRSVMRNAIGKAVLVLTLCANSVAQSPRQMTREKQMQFATNECFPKAGLGIITTSLYIELRSDRDQLLLDAGKKWIGLKAGVPEVVIVLMNQLSEDEPVHRLLFLDELINVFNACAIQGSNLPSMLCTLWDKDKTGGSVKKGRQIVYGKLSIVGGLAINDISDFSRVFGSHSVKGLYDRFIFGYSTSHVRYRPLRVVAEKFDTKPVHFPQWVWDAKDEWIGDDLSRGRLSQHALRIALITSACNGDTEITKSCLEAALRFCEWQQRLRQVFKPGLAETKDAEAFEAAWTALKEQFKKQKKSGEVHAKSGHQTHYL